MSSQINLELDVPNSPITILLDVPVVPEGLPPGLFLLLSDGNLLTVSGSLLDVGGP